MFIPVFIFSEDICYLCDKPLKRNDDVRYHGGPYVMHTACIERIQDHEPTDDPEK